MRSCVRIRVYAFCASGKLSSNVLYQCVLSFAQSGGGQLICFIMQYALLHFAITFNYLIFIYRFIYRIEKEIYKVYIVFGLFSGVKYSRYDV